MQSNNNTEIFQDYVQNSACNINNLLKFAEKSLKTQMFEVLFSWNCVLKTISENKSNPLSFLQTNEYAEFKKYIFDNLTTYKCDLNTSHLNDLCHVDESSIFKSLMDGKICNKTFDVELLKKIYYLYKTIPSQQFIKIESDMKKSFDKVQQLETQLKSQQQQQKTPIVLTPSSPVNEQEDSVNKKRKVD